MIKRLIFFVLLGFFSCRKVELPPVVDGDPVFLVEGNVDGTPLKLTAGEADYYLFTSYERDSGGVLNMTGLLKLQDCTTDCGPYLKLSFREKTASTAGNFNINSAFQTGALDFYSATPEQEAHYVLQLNADPTIYQLDQVSSYTWTFDNGLPDAFEANPLVELPNFDESLRVVLTLGTDVGGICSVEKTIDFTTPSSNCRVNFAFSIAQNGIFNAITAQPTGSPPFAYSWSDGSTNAATNVFNPQDSVFALTCLTVVDNEGCEVISCPAAKVFGNPVSGFVQYFCYADFSSTAYIDSLSAGVPVQYGSLVVEYGDEAGTVYRSDMGIQDGSTFFELLEIEDYEDNENDESTKKINFQTNVLLYDSIGNTHRLVTDASTFAIAYPD